jgi:CubicO group peptidase (beta-lactamase class C family)
MNMPPLATLANWRTEPYSSWAFQHVEQLVRCVTIDGAEQPRALPSTEGAASARANASPQAVLAALQFEHAGQRWKALDALHEGATDGLLVLHRGQVVAEHYANDHSVDTRHIVFSVSKSITGALAGVLVEQGLLDPAQQVAHYLPLPPGSAYLDCTVRQVLDMTVDIRFVEDYLDPLGDVARYRVAMDWNPPGLVHGDTGLLDFIAGLPRAGGEHGAAFHYVSPNADLLGWLLEVCSGRSVPELLREYLWQPMGAEHSSWITVDRHGASRTAGGLCCTLGDMARVGELMRLGGAIDGQQVLPPDWVADIFAGGDPQAWANGDMTGLFSSGRYRAQWYCPGTDSGVLCAIGIHGQWIWIDRHRDIVIAKQSSQAIPADERLDHLNLALFRALCASISQ